jgi:23S rRNA (uracil1939-C5)-methyltransferase
MGRRRRGPKPPVEVSLSRLGLKGPVGTDEEGKQWRVRAAPIGAKVRAQPGRKQIARRLEIVEPAPGQITPECPVFGQCGGCQLQEMPLEAQRTEKRKMVEMLVGAQSAPVRGADAGYRYRNKIELSFGVRAYLPEADKDSCQPQGSFIGFHPPGWFSKIVPIVACPLASDAMSAVIEVVAGLQLEPAWDNRAHEGHWRHLVIRQGETLCVTLVTSSGVQRDAVAEVADAIWALPGVGGVLWVVTDRLSDVAQGELTEVFHGVPWVEQSLGGVPMRLPHDAFFQVNAQGAEILLQTIREALGPPLGATLLDLYCGVGALGLALGSGYERVIGIDSTVSAIAVAQDNAEAAGVKSEWHAGTVEAVLPTLNLQGAQHVLVDPPRAGLHPTAAKFLAQLQAQTLVYIACSPASLARDRPLLEAGGWRLDGLWTVDLFPQTPHVEAVARFVR